MRSAPGENPSVICEISNDQSASAELFRQDHAQSVSWSCSGTSRSSRLGARNRHAARNSILRVDHQQRKWLGGLREMFNRSQPGVSQSSPASRIISNHPCSDVGLQDRFVELVEP